MAIQIRAEGGRNAQVSDKAKDKVYSWFEDRGVSGARALLLHHYEQGDYVAVSEGGVLGADDLGSFNTACGEAVNDYWRNKSIKDGVIWLHRDWIDGI